MAEAFEPRRKLNDVFEIAAHDEPEEVPAEEELSWKEEHVLSQHNCTSCLKNSRLKSSVFLKREKRLLSMLIVE